MTTAAIAQTTRATGDGIKAATLNENMMVKSVDSNHIGAFSFSLWAVFEAVLLCNRINQKRSSSETYTDTTKAIDHASPFER
jgi:hypothetical protein